MFPRASSILSKGAIAGAFVLTYVALEWISFIHEYKGLPITPWNPGLGVMFALMVFVGAFKVQSSCSRACLAAEIFLLQSDVEWPIIIGIGALTSSSYAVVAEVSRRYLYFDAGLTHLRDVAAAAGRRICRRPDQRLPSHRRSWLRPETLKSAMSLMRRCRCWSVTSSVLPS